MVVSPLITRAHSSAGNIYSVPPPVKTNKYPLTREVLYYHATVGAALESVAGHRQPVHEPWFALGEYYYYYYYYCTRVIYFSCMYSMYSMHLEVTCLRARSTTLLVPCMIRSPWTH